MASLNKSVRLQVLVDEEFNKMVKKGAHDSWMSVGQYMRDIVSLMEGRTYDDAADLVHIGKEISLEGLDVLREAADRRGISIKEFCLSIAKRKDTSDQEADDSLKSSQTSLFG